MKKNVIIVLLLFIALFSNAAVKIRCDVIYKNMDGEWSDFLRTDVTFCLGHEINYTFESRTVFAVIWSPDNQRIVLKMKGNYVQTQELNMFNMFLLLCTNDMLNQGIDFELYNINIKQEWKIFAKDEIGLLIDSGLGSTQSGAIYNEGTLKNRENGFYIDRKKPKDNPKHNGDMGEIVYKDQWLFYIVKVNGKYYAMERCDFTMIKSEVGEILIGDFSVSDKRVVFYNKSRDIDGYKFIVLEDFDRVDDCKKFIKSRWP